mmetsp:Transcript_68135/g.205779  ORF Transcript_68135/g.205779 Transcript_68135/m.205779 type:complete len:400 (-) Transcript_68135:194-1393(-)
MTAILLNTLFVGLHIQLVSKDADGKISEGEEPDATTPVGVLVLQFMFCLIFCTELVLRWLTDGLIGFFRTQEGNWNAFDTVLILSNVVELFVEIFQSKHELLVTLSSLRVLRVFRLVRVLRIIRTWIFFRELRMMLLSILGSLKSFLWVMMVFTLVFFVFGLCITWNAYQHRLEKGLLLADDPDEAFLAKQFGTVNRSMLSLFMVMTGGLDWSDLYDTLKDMWLSRFLLMTFVSFGFFAATHVVTGVFVESALRSSEQDRDALIQEQLQQKERYIRSMFHLFEEIDTNSSGCISLDEFEKQLDDERAVAFFKAIKLDASQARTLFTLLDVDQSGYVDVEEFLMGCEKLQGEARSLDIAVMQYEIRWLMHMFLGFADFVEIQFSGISPGTCSPGASTTWG